MNSTLDYQRPAPHSRVRLGFSMTGMACGLVVALLLGVGSILAMSAARVYANFSMRLPAFSILSLQAMQLLRDTFLIPLIPIPVATGFGFPLIDRVYPKATRPYARSVARLILIVLLLLLPLVIVAGLALPMLYLIQGLSGGSKG